MVQGGVKLIIADDHPAIRRAIRKLLEGAPDLMIVGEAVNGQEAIESVEKYHPDVLLLDLQMPVMDGIEVMDYLAQHGSKVRILILSAFQDPQYINEVLRRGAWGYLVKEEAPSQLFEAIRQTAHADGERVRPPVNFNFVNGWSGI